MPQNKCRECECEVFEPLHDFNKLCKCGHSHEHPMKLRIFKSDDGYFNAVVVTPNHQGDRGYTRTFIQFGFVDDLVKDYGSVEAFFNHIDSVLVDAEGKVNENEFVEAQKMGMTYTGWIEIPDMPE
jgi:hypothetical protein